LGASADHHPAILPADPINRGDEMLTLTPQPTNEVAPRKNRFNDAAGILWIRVCAKKCHKEYPNWLHRLFASGNYPECIKSITAPFKKFSIPAKRRPGFCDHLYVQDDALKKISRARKGTGSLSFMTAGKLFKSRGKKASWLDPSFLCTYRRTPHPVLKLLRPDSPKRWCIRTKVSEKLATGPQPLAYCVADVDAIIRFEARQRKALVGWITIREGRTKYGLKSLRWPRDPRLKLEHGAEGEIRLYQIKIKLQAQLTVTPSRPRDWKLRWLCNEDDLQQVKNWVVDHRHGKIPDVVEGKNTYLPESTLLKRLNKGKPKNEHRTHGWLRQAHLDGRIGRISKVTAHQKNPKGEELYHYDLEQAKAEYALSMKANGEHPRRSDGVYAPYVRPTVEDGHHEVSKKLDAIKDDTGAIDGRTKGMETTQTMIVKRQRRQGKVLKQIDSTTKDIEFSVAEVPAMRKRIDEWTLFPEPPKANKVPPPGPKVQRCWKLAHESKQIAIDATGKDGPMKELYDYLREHGPADYELPEFAAWRVYNRRYNSVVDQGDKINHPVGGRTGRSIVKAAEL
jgi:hypothetical protein